jgi:hypothetical protein
MYGVLVSGDNQGSIRDVVTAYLEIRMKDPTDVASTTTLIAEL